MCSRLLTGFDVQYEWEDQGNGGSDDLGPGAPNRPQAFQDLGLCTVRPLPQFWGWRKQHTTTHTIHTGTSHFGFLYFSFFLLIFLCFCFSQLSPLPRNFASTHRALPLSCLKVSRWGRRDGCFPVMFYPKVKPGESTRSRCRTGGRHKGTVKEKKTEMEKVRKRFGGGGMVQELPRRVLEGYCCRTLHYCVDTPRMSPRWLALLMITEKHR